MKFEKEFAVKRKSTTITGFWINTQLSTVAVSSQQFLRCSFIKLFAVLYDLNLSYDIDGNLDKKKELYKEAMTILEMY